MKKDIGGQRLGSGNKMQVELHNYGRSTHDLGSVIRTTMAPGVLVPFKPKIALNGDTFEITLQSLIRTAPTFGPIFGSFKFQVDVFSIPVRLYNAMLHMNALNVGMDMAKVKFPQMTVKASSLNYASEIPIEEQQINPSSLLSYLGIKGVGKGNSGGTGTIARNFNALAYLAYFDIYKNYYANKQEEQGVVITTEEVQELPIVRSATQIEYNAAGEVIARTTGGWNYGDYIQTLKTLTTKIEIDFDADKLKVDSIGLLAPTKPYMANRVGVWTQPTQKTGKWVIDSTKSTEEEEIVTLGKTANKLKKILAPEPVLKELYLKKFPLSNIDDMRELILAAGKSQVTLTDTNKSPYNEALSMVTTDDGVHSSSYFDMVGLAVKTYQSDKFNNWVNTDWIDGDNGISKVTAVKITDNELNLDALNLAQKVYNMLNRIAVSGGSYEDWQEAVYGDDVIRRAESPIYCGGMSGDIVFDEVVSTASTTNEALGSLAGRGTQQNKKGGHITIKVTEPSIILPIMSITPRIDYSQGNDWYVNLRTMDDLHKPALDGIGFQELITDEMAFWDTDATTPTPKFKSAGKQPAWINYMTDTNSCYGNFAKKNDQMFMTLNRRYEEENGTIKDLTTYIDPTKFNYAFAEQDLTGQNFWVQVGMNMQVRRKMSAKIIPNL